MRCTASIVCHMNVKVKKVWVIAALVLAFFLIFFGNICTDAALYGFDLWLCYVMPSVFPFFVCISLLRESGIMGAAGKGFRLPLFFATALSGAPSGSGLCVQLEKDSVIHTDDLPVYCAACNMLSPAFLIGTLSVMTGGYAFVIPVITGHYLAALAVILLARGKKDNIPHIGYEKTQKSFFTVLCNAISDGVKSSITVCGVIIFFTVLIAVITSCAITLGMDVQNPVFVFLLSLIEVTSGSEMLLSIGLDYSLTCALLSFSLSFGGLCIMAQTFSIVSLGVKKYLLTKLIMATVSGVAAYIVSKLIPQSQSVFSNAAETFAKAAEGSLALCVIALSSVIGCGCVWLFAVSRARPK